jgi:LysM repeat protein
MGPRSVRRGSLFIAAVVFALFLLKPSPVLAQDTGTPVVHIVAWGDTVTSIAAQYGVTPDAIINANELEAPNTIYAGQRLIIPGAQPNTAQAAPAGGRHTVQPGETLYSIATHYGITVDALRAANNLADNTVLAGQSLTIPTGDAPSTETAAAADGAEGVHTVQPGETLYRISLQYGVSVSRLADFNQLINPSSIHAGQQLRIPGSATATTPGYAPAETVRTHVVQPGETLYAIATRYGVTTAVLTQANNLANPSLIHAGLTLTIPSADALAAPAPAAAPAGTAKSIVVDVSEQRAYVYENGQLRWTFVISTGMPPTETLRGHFYIQNKIPNAYASTWDLQMPNWLGFYWAGPLQNGFHALPIMSNGVRLWGGVLGQKASYGCVILGIEDAQLLYDWAEVGTSVTVQD